MQKPSTENLTAYPHILNTLHSIWGTRKGKEYLQGLIFNTSGRVNADPQGFSVAALYDITALLEYHDHQFPQYLDKQTVWYRAKF